MRVSKVFVVEVWPRADAEQPFRASVRAVEDLEPVRCASSAEVLRLLLGDQPTAPATRPVRARRAEASLPDPPAQEN
jgi:hypothetical protein